MPVLKGALHTHTTCSDGQLTPPELVAAYRELGFQFVAITDHDHLLRPDYWDALPKDEPDFLVFKGVELTVFERGYVHVGRDPRRSRNAAHLQSSGRVRFALRKSDRRHLGRGVAHADRLRGSDQKGLLHAGVRRAGDSVPESRFRRRPHAGHVRPVVDHGRLSTGKGRDPARNSCRPAHELGPRTSAAGTPPPTLIARVSITAARLASDRVRIDSACRI